MLGDTLAAMQRGMHAANPEAELIAWPYGQFICWGTRRRSRRPGALPAGRDPPAQLRDRRRETGSWASAHPTWDYWLSYVGPSDLFRGRADAPPSANGTRVSAKLQVGCSHEVATTQFVPAPGLLYRKYRAMHDLGVSAAMQSWYFGTYPSLMTQRGGRTLLRALPEEQPRLPR